MKKNKKIFGQSLYSVTFVLNIIGQPIIGQPVIAKNSTRN